MNYSEAELHRREFLASLMSEECQQVSTNLWFSHVHRSHPPQQKKMYRLDRNIKMPRRCEYSDGPSDKYMWALIRVVLLPPSGQPVFCFVFVYVLLVDGRPYIIWGYTERYGACVLHILAFSCIVMAIDGTEVRKQLIWMVGCVRECVALRYYMWLMGWVAAHKLGRINVRNSFVDRAPSGWRWFLIRSLLAI